jgi:hypothetical protein
MTSDDDHGKTEPNTNTKAGRLIEEYDRGEGYGGRFERLWTADDDRRESLRGLADQFNRRLLRAAVDGEVDNLYRLLTDDVSSGNRTEARGRLVESGLNAEQLEQGFMTYQAIRSYLGDVRGAEYDHEANKSVSRTNEVVVRCQPHPLGRPVPRVSRTNEVVARLRSRTRCVAAQNLERLVDADEVEMGEFNLLDNVDSSARSVTRSTASQNCWRQAAVGIGSDRRPPLNNTVTAVSPVSPRGATAAVASCSILSNAVRSRFGVWQGCRAVRVRRIPASGRLVREQS